MPIIGLDLGEHSFRAVEMEKQKKQGVVLNFGFYDNPKISLHGDTKSYIESLKSFISESGFSTPNVVIGLSEADVFMRIIKLPEMKEGDLKNSIAFEAEQYIPLPLAQVNMSYQKIETVENGKMMNVQIVAAPKNKVDALVSVIRGANLIPKAIEPETLALTRALLGPEDSLVSSILLDIGFSTTVIIIYHNGHVRFTKTLPFGGDAITKVVSQQLNLDYAQAEEYKKVYGMDESHFEGRIFQVIKPLVDSIVADVKKAGIFFTSSFTDATIKRVIISGGTARMPNFLLYLANNLNYEVVMGNPLKEIGFSRKIESKKATLVDYASLYTTALGLGLRGL